MKRAIESHAAPNDSLNRSANSAAFIENLCVSTLCARLINSGAMRQGHNVGGNYGTGSLTVKDINTSRQCGRWSFCCEATLYNALQQTRRQARLL